MDRDHQRHRDRHRHGADCLVLAGQPGVRGRYRFGDAREPDRRRVFRGLYPAGDEVAGDGPGAMLEHYPDHHHGCHGIFRVSRLRGAVSKPVDVKESNFMDTMIWAGIITCFMHSAMFSGLNLGFFGVSRLKLFVQADMGNPDAIRILSLRKDSHFLLATLLWGNTASNVLIALLSDSILTGVGAFLFSTIGITLLGEKNIA